MLVSENFVRRRKPTILGKLWSLLDVHLNHGDDMCA